MGSAIWVDHTVDLERNSVSRRLPHALEVDEIRLVIGEIQDNCLVLRALSAHRYRIVWRDGRFASGGHLVVYPHPRCSRLTTLDLRLNRPKGLGRLLRRKVHLRAIGSRIMTGLAAALGEHEFIRPAEIGFENLQATTGKSEECPAL